MRQPDKLWEAIQSYPIVLSLRVKWPDHETDHLPPQHPLQRLIIRKFNFTPPLVLTLCWLGFRRVSLFFLSNLKRHAANVNSIMLQSKVAKGYNHLRHHVLCHHIQTLCEYHCNPVLQQPRQISKPNALPLINKGKRTHTWLLKLFPAPPSSNIT